MHYSNVLLALVVASTDCFAPRPGYTLRSNVARAPLSPTSLYAQKSTTLTLERIKESDTKDLPFYAKEASTLQEPPLLSSDNYQQQASSIALLGDTPKEDDNELAEYAGLASWIGGLSSFLLINNFVGPWPAALLQAIPVKAFGLTHAIAGMLFGGGIILTTLIEWLATDSKNTSVLNFYFDKVPTLDAMVVLPALTASILSGVGLAVDHYGSLGQSPFHVVGAISTLLAFAVWWAVTDVTTQGAAMNAIQEWTESNEGEDKAADVPGIVQFRKFSNVVSCLFVAAIYGFMVLKPGYTPAL